MTALLECIGLSLVTYAEHEENPFPGPAWIQYVEDARAVDAERRSRER